MPSSDAANAHAASRHQASDAPSGAALDCRAASMAVVAMCSMATGGPFSLTAEKT